MSADAPSRAAAGRAPGHGDHWLAALPQDDPRLRDAVAVPVDAPDALRLQRTPLTEALDMVQVTMRRRLVTAYPEPRATALAQARPRELVLWETRVEGWLVVEQPDAGALTVFLTDLAESAPRYAAASGRGLALELGALAYTAGRVESDPGPPRLMPASRLDERFLPDDYWFVALVEDVRPAGDGEVLECRFQGDLRLPVVFREATGLAPGDHAQGVLWLTGRLPPVPTTPR